MIGRYAGCGKRACTLTSSLHVKDRAQTNGPANTRTNTTLCGEEKHTGREHRSKTPWKWSGLIAASIVAASTSTESEEPMTPELADPPPQILELMDELYNMRQYQELKGLLENYAHLNSADLLWRRARVQWEMIKMEGQNTEIFARSERVAQIQDLVNLVDQALALDETNSSAHRWKAILSNACSSLAGFKDQFQNLQTVKYHLERAIELDPTDSTSLTLLGAWHMNLLELPMLPKMFVTVFWQIPSPCGYEDALEMFLKAEELAPNASIGNLFYAGKAYFRLGQKTKAKHYMELALAQPASAITAEDLVYLDEAKRFWKTNLVP